MGKDKGAQRTKNNARPSSSGRSAEMLGTAPINPFMSFTTLKESMGVDEQMADSHLDPNFQVVLKKMNKKDGVTKLKALQEFSQLCSSSEPDQVVAILPFWPRLYSLLSLDVEHRVREAAHIAHRSVVSKVKRNIAPYLKQLAGPWFVAQCDTYAPAASAATMAFNEAFPPNKLSEAIAFCQEEILNYIYENLVVHTPQTLCNPKTMTPEEIESKYIRTVISSLQGYGLYLSRLTAEQLEAAKELNLKLVSDSKFWKFSKHQFPQVRSAWFSALSALCQHSKFLVAGEEKRIGQAVFGSLDESDATVLPVVWEAALVSLVAMDGLLEVVSFEKLVLPKLLRVCREGGRGSAAAIFPSLLPFLSKMPSNIVKDTHTFHNKFFSSIREGFSQRSVQLSSSESKAVSKAFVECLQYVIQLNQDEVFGLELLQQHLLPCLKETLLIVRRGHTSDSLYSSVSKLLHSWGRCSEGSLQRKLLHAFCSDLSVALQTMAVGEEQLVVCPVDSQDSSQEPETEENKDTVSPKQVQAALKDILKSQVDFISSMLQRQGQGRSFKVKFADLKVQGAEEEISTSDSQTVSSEVTHCEFLALGKALCCCYMQSVVKSESADYLPPLVSLVKLLNTSSIYADMAQSVNLAKKENLFSEHFIKWLKPHSILFCRAAVSLSIPLLNQLPAEQQNLLFDELLKDGVDVNQLSWILEESNMCNGAASLWLHSPHLSEVLRTLTEQACSSENIVVTWDLLLSGCGIGANEDHIFCNSALDEIIRVIVTNLNDMWHSSSVLPPWTGAASKIVTKIYSEQRSFLRTSSSSQQALCLAFEICLWDSTHSADVEALSKLWKSGTRALVRMHGHSSSTILQLSASLVDVVLTLLYGKPLHPKSVLGHAASQLAEFVEIVTDSFSDVDGDCERKTVCSQLLTALFSNSPDDSEGSDNKSSGLRSISVLHRQGLESLADCVEPFHSGIDSSQTIPQSSLTELVGAGYWNAIVASVLSKLSSVSSFENFYDGEDETFFSWDVFLDMFILFCDVRYIALHFSTTELGSALHQLTKDSEDSIKKIISTLQPTRAEKVHDLLLAGSEKKAAYERAHKMWHDNAFSSSEICVSITPASRKSVEDDCLRDIDLSPLDAFSEKLLATSLLSKVTLAKAVFWLDAVYKLHIRFNERLVSNITIDTCAVAVVHDTIRVMKFLNAVVSRAPQLLAGSNWDQVLIAIATWIHCAYETIMEKPVDQGNSSRLSRKVCAFLQGVCKLFVTFNVNLQKLQSGSIELTDAQRGSLKETLPREWRDVFAGECEHKILAMWTDIVENIKPSEESPPLIAVLDGLGQALQHSTIAFLQPSKDAEVVYEPLLKFAPHFLLHNLGSVRLTAYHLLMKIVPYMVKRDAASLADLAEGEEGKECMKSEDRISLLHFEDILASSQTVVSTVLSEFKLGTSCTVQPFTDSYTYTSGYLLVWSLMLEMCKEAETELKSQYAIWLKNASENYVESLLNSVFRLLPQEAFDEKLKITLDCFTKQPNLSFGGCWSSVLVSHMACSVLYGALSCLPALARQWWTNTEPKLATIIDRVVSQHISPSICAAEMSAVAKMQDKAVENMAVRVHSNVREVVATYTVDDLTMELVVRLPTNHPLTPMIVEIGKRNAAAAVRWRQWLMQLTMFLTHQNGTLWDGLALWRNNVVRKYEGVEECYICFCVLSGSNFQLPKLSCRTCRKKFHSTCLYKWFQTSNKSTCPICRNLF
ncbi:E3 ubiquitin-protein ligase listerin [Thrips palmi]|uniref:E3 ubiquitin-protein ligase listerin n=1 Tax=Thrips palmi TaxID=161013 RepID=A0A6P8Y7U5_THRPL|nr:E3 ubiquitin-protein ligase listerin [Thrips palmi]